jgi:hypothetical protein
MELKVKNAAQAADVVISYLQKNQSQNAPQPGLNWQEKTLYSVDAADYAITSKLLSAADWAIEIYQGVAPLINTVYQITIFNTRSHWFWEGSVKADASLTEVSQFRALSDQESLRRMDELNRKNQVPPPRQGTYGH